MLPGTPRRGPSSSRGFPAGLVTPTRLPTLTCQALQPEPLGVVEALLPHLHRLYLSFPHYPLLIFSLHRERKRQNETVAGVRWRDAGQLREFECLFKSPGCITSVIIKATDHFYWALTRARHHLISIQECPRAVGHTGHLWPSQSSSVPPELCLHSVAGHPATCGPVLMENNLSYGHRSSEACPVSTNAFFPAALAPDFLSEAHPFMAWTGYFHPLLWLSEVSASGRNHGTGPACPHLL